jgi:hypothetical protein
MDSPGQEPDLRSRFRRAWINLAVISVLFGGVYGATLGAVVATMDGAARTLASAAAIMALITGVGGTNYGTVFGAVNRVRFGRLFGFVAGAVGGAILGASLGIVGYTAFGSLPGGLIGWIVGRFGVRPERRLLAKVLGASWGACIGVISVCYLRDSEAAVAGAMRGLGLGALDGVVLVLLFFVALSLLPPRR